MEQIQPLLRGARKLVQMCANVQPGERVLVVTDTGRSPRIGEALYHAALAAGGTVVKVVMEPGKHPGAEVPEMVAAAMKVSDVIFGMTTMSLYHTQARGEACAAGARILVGTEITEDMLISGGIEADFIAIRPQVEALAQRLRKAREVRLVTAGGTDVRANIAGRPVHAHTGLVHHKGEAMGPPDIEVFVPPREGTTEGTIVVDASATALGIIHHPIRLLVHAGRVVEITGGAEAQKLRALLEKAQDPNCWNIAEIAVGFNPCGRVTGHIIEDEGVLGTCHMALGNNVTMGGKNPAKLHIDLVMWRPMLYLDGELAHAAEPVSASRS